MLHCHALTKGYSSQKDQNPKGTKHKVYHVYTSSRKDKVQEKSQSIPTSVSKIINGNDAFQCSKHHRGTKQKL